MVLHNGCVPNVDQAMVYPAEQARRETAGLAIRTEAFALDFIVIAAYLVALTVVFAGLRVVVPEIGESLFGGPVRGELTGFLVLTLPVVLAFAYAEASPAHATLGKRRLGLRVVRADGSPLTVGPSLVRSVAKFAPWELAHACVWQAVSAGDATPPLVIVGFVLVYALIGANIASVLLSPRDQALYDRLAGTVVERAASA